MRGIRLRSTLKSVIAILCAACFLTFAQGGLTQVLAAEEWETWPKKPADTEASGAATAGEEAGKKTYAGMSAGTIGWIALGTAAVIGIAIAAGGRGAGEADRRLQLTPDRRPLAHRLNRVPIPLAVGVLFAALMFHSLSASAASPEDDPAVPAILDRAESLFQSMKSSRLPGDLRGTQREIPGDDRRGDVVRISSAKQAPPGKVTAADTPSAPAKASPPDLEAVRRDFVAGGPIAHDYWDAFLRRFDPDIALEHSRWEIGSVGKDRAEILLTHHGADHPATLKMFLEDGGWKVGLVETFWTR